MTVPFRVMCGINTSGVMYTTEDFLKQINKLGMIDCYECGRMFNTSNSRPVQSACGHVKCSNCFYYTVSKGDHYCQICANATPDRRKVETYQQTINHFTPSTCLPNPTTGQIIMVPSDTAIRIRKNPGVTKITQRLSVRDSDSNSYSYPNPRQHQYPGLPEIQSQHKQHVVWGQMSKIKQRRGSRVSSKTASYNQPITSFAPTPTPIKSVTTLPQTDDLTRSFACQKEFPTWNGFKKHCHTLRHNVNTMTNIDLQTHLQPKFNAQSKPFENRAFSCTHEKQRQSALPLVTSTATTEYNGNDSTINLKEQNINSKIKTPKRYKKTLENPEIRQMRNMISSIIFTPRISIPPYPLLHKNQRRKSIIVENQSTNLLLTPMLKKPTTITSTTVASSPLDMDATRSNNIISNNDSADRLGVYDFNLNDADSDWGTTYKPISKKVKLAFSKLPSYVEAPLQAESEVEAATTVNPNIIVTLPPTPPTIKSRTKTGIIPSAPQLPLPPRTVPAATTATTYIKEQFETSLPRTKPNRLNRVTFDFVPEQELHTETETESEYNSINNKVILTLEENPTAVPFEIGAASVGESTLAQEPPQPPAQGLSNLFQGECPWSVVTMVYEENGNVYAEYSYS